MASEIQMKKFKELLESKEQKLQRLTLYSQDNIGREKKSREIWKASGNRLRDNVVYEEKLRHSLDEMSKTK